MSFLQNGTMMILSWLLLLVGVLPLGSVAPCVNVTGCSGGGTSTLSCPALQLTEFPCIPVEDAAQVEILDLSYNELAIITAVDLQHFTQLEELNVIYNDITYIEAGSFSNNQELSTILLESNPLHCDCGLRWLREFLETLPVDSEGRCNSPPLLAGSLLSHLNLSQLTCECPTECIGNSSCKVLLGLCECDPGYRGDNCSQVCHPETFGSNCSETCVCKAGSCHHVTGDCTCPPGHLGTNCSHDCSGAPDCALLVREICSLETPENTCGTCNTPPVANRTDEWGNDSCVTILPNPSTTPCCEVPVRTTDTQGYASCVTQTLKSSTIPQSPSGSPDPSEGRPLYIIILTSFLLMLIVALILVLTTILLCWKHSAGKKTKISPSPRVYGFDFDLKSSNSVVNISDTH